MRRTWAVALVMVVAGGLSACNAPPRGKGVGRVETTDSTRAETRSAQVQPAALIEFSDQVAQQLAEDLSKLPEFNGGYRSTVVFGDLSNKTGIVPTTDFQAFRTRVRQKLLQSTVVRNKIRWVESLDKVEDLRRRELGTGRSDVLQEGTAGGRSTPLNADYTYFLDGEMYRVDRGNGAVNLYMLSFNLANAQSREIVWTNSPYEIKQVP